MAERKNKGAKKPETKKPVEPPAPKKTPPREGKVYTLKNSAQRAAKEDGLIEGQYEIVEHKKKGEPSGWKYVYTESYRSMRQQMIGDVKPAEHQDAPAGEKDKVIPVVDDGSGVEVEHEDEVVVEPEPTGPDIKLTPEQEAQAHAVAVKATTVVEPPKAPEPPKVTRQLTPDEQFKKDLAEIAEQKRKEAAEKAKQTPIVVDVASSPPVAPGQPPVTEQKPAGATYICPECKEGQPDKKAWVQHRLEKHNIKPKAKETWLHRSEIESPTKYVWEVADEMLEENPKVTRKEVIAECERRGVAHWTARTQYQAWLTARRESERNAAEVNGKNNGKK